MLPKEYLANLQKWQKANKASPGISMGEAGATSHVPNSTPAPTPAPAAAPPVQPPAPTPTPEPPAAAPTPAPDPSTNSMEGLNTQIQTMIQDVWDKTKEGKESRAETSGALKEEMQGHVDNQMANLSELAQNRSDSITQGGLAQMRQAAGIAGIAGQSLGGSFADAQRQVMMSTQGLQNEAYGQNLAAQQDVLQQQADQAFAMGNNEIGMQFQEQAQALGTQTQLGSQGLGQQFQAGQADIDRGIEEQRYQDTLQAQAGETGAIARTGLTDHGIRQGKNPFENEQGQALNFGELDSATRDYLDQIAASEGTTAESYYNDLVSGGGTDRYDVSPEQTQHHTQEIMAKFPIPPEIDSDLRKRLSKARSKGEAGSRQRRKYEEDFDTAYSAVRASGLSEEEFSELYKLPLPDKFNQGQSGYNTFG